VRRCTQHALNPLQRAGVVYAGLADRLANHGPKGETEASIKNKLARGTTVHSKGNDDRGNDAERSNTKETDDHGTIPPSCDLNAADDQGDPQGAP